MLFNIFPTHDPFTSQLREGVWPRNSTAPSKYEVMDLVSGYNRKTLGKRTEGLEALLLYALRKADYDVRRLRFVEERSEDGLKTSWRFEIDDPA